MEIHSTYICASFLDMNKNLLLVGVLVVMASCGRYSQVVDLPKKEQMEANPRVYGEVDGPARQSKQTYTNPADAADRSAKIKDILFGTGQSAADIAAQEASAPVATDSASAAK